MWTELTERAKLAGRKIGFMEGLPWGALLCLTVAVLTVLCSLYWYSRGL